MSDVFDDMDDELAEVEQADAEAYIRSALDMVLNAKPMPLSSSVRVERDELAELLEGHWSGSPKRSSRPDGC